jgi:signal transduction histidine kinase
MVVIAFVVPLGLMVRNQARTRALNEAHQTARSVASGLAVASSLAVGLESSVVELVVATSGDGTTSVFLADGTVIGAPAARSAAVLLSSGGRALTADAEGGVEVLIPVTGAGATVVVRTFVTDAALTEGVLPAGLALTALGLLMIAAGVVLADRLGRSLVRPVADLAGTARRMASGDLTARVKPDGPHELADVGTAFNQLADRVNDLILEERESLADLSHGLRTPLTALRLQAEMLTNRESAQPMLNDLDRLGMQVDGLIAEARRRSPAAGPRIANVCDITRERFDFWGVLAEEQGRDHSAEIPGTPILVALTHDELVAAIDTVLENVFAHTAAGVGYRVSVQDDGKVAMVVLEDDGPGYPSGSIIARGTSAAGSTGLGLDIVRRAAERSGGSVTLASSASGGARTEISLGKV